MSAEMERLSWIHSTRQTHPVKEDSCLPNF